MDRLEHVGCTIAQWSSTTASYSWVLVPNASSWAGVVEIGGAAASAEEALTSSVVVDNPVPAVVAARFEAGLVVPLYAVIFVLSVSGNLLVLATLACNRRMRTVTNVYLLNLALADLLLGVFCVPVTLTGQLLRNFVFGAAMCKLIPYCQAVSVSVGVWTLVALSLERYAAICRPLQARQWQTRRHAYRSLAFVWVAAGVWSVPAGAASTLQALSHGRHKCREQWSSNWSERAYSLFLDVVLLLVPLLVMGAAYSLIVSKLWRRLKREMNGADTPVAALSAATNTPSAVMPCGDATEVIPIVNGDGRLLNRVRTPQGSLNGHAELGGLPRSRWLQAPHHTHHHHHHNHRLHRRSSTLSPNLVTAPTPIAVTATACLPRKSRAGLRLKSWIKQVRRPRSKTSLPTQTWPRQNQMTTSTNQIQVPCSMPCGCPFACPHSASCCRCSSSPAGPNNAAGSEEEDTESGSASASASVASTAGRRKQHRPLRSNYLDRSIEAKKKVIRMLFVLVLEFFVCWAPLHALNTWHVFRPDQVYSAVGATGVSLVQALAYLSACANPITYCFMNRRFRQAFQTVFRCRAFKFGASRRAMGGSTIRYGGGAVPLEGVPLPLGGVLAVASPPVENHSMAAPASLVFLPRSEADSLALDAETNV